MGQRHSLFKETSQQDTANFMEDEDHVDKLLSISDSVHDRPSMEEYFEPSGSAMDQCNWERVGPTKGHFILKVLKNSRNIPEYGNFQQSSDSIQGPSGLNNSRPCPCEEKKLISVLRRSVAAMAIIALFVPVTMIFVVLTAGPTNTTASSSNTTSPSSNTTSPSSNNTAPSSNNTAPLSNNTTPSSNTTPPTTTKRKKLPDACIERVPYIRRPIPIKYVHFVNSLTIGHKDNLLYVTGVDIDIHAHKSVNEAISLDDLKHTLINKKYTTSIVADRKSRITYISGADGVYKHDFTTNISQTFGFIHPQKYSPHKLYYVDRLIYFLDALKWKICYLSENQNLHFFNVNNGISENDLSLPRATIKTIGFVETPVTTFAVIEHKNYYLYVKGGKLYRNQHERTKQIAAGSYTMALDIYNVVILSDNFEHAMYKYDVKTERLVPYANYTAPPSQIIVFDFDKNNRIVYLDANGSVVQWVPAPTKEYGTKCEMIVNVP